MKIVILTHIERDKKFKSKIHCQPLDKGHLYSMDKVHCPAVSFKKRFYSIDAYIYNADEQFDMLLEGSNSLMH